MPRRVDLTLVGQRFGRLRVMKFSGTGRRSRSFWACICDCGKRVTVGGQHLRNGDTRSCGCLSRELFIKRNYKHGGHRTAEYRAWRGMHNRCNWPTNKAYASYGGRGIAICKRWLGEDGFENFLADMGSRPSPKHSIDRIDNNGSYEPSNCRWATASEQRRNQRPLKPRRIIEYNGRSQALAAWARETGIGVETIRFRLKAGWSIVRALSEPSRQSRH